MAILAGGRVRSVAKALGGTPLDNAELALRYGVDESWIVERTGIERRWVGARLDELAATAAERAMCDAGLGGDDIDLVILATSTAVRQVPATAVRIAKRLGSRCGCVDINAVCSGFVYGLQLAYGQLALGAQRVLVVGADSFSELVDYEDRNSAILFGDGAGAVVLEAADDAGLLGYHASSDPDGEDLLYAERNGLIVMEGREIFRRAVTAMADSVAITLDRAGLGFDDVDLVVPHQANVRIIDALARRVGFTDTPVAINIAGVGNSSAGTVPMALADHIAGGAAPAAGDRVLFVSFGAGLVAASALVQW
jgi:3-oxoacyl-[acyl-carrier-protein] synthase III